MINREIMTKNPVCCLLSDSVKKAAEEMKKGDFGALPVVESKESGRIVGIITDRDITLKTVAEGMNPETTVVESAMNSKVFTVHEDGDVNDTLSIMADKQVRRIPVVDAEDCIVGIIAQADIATKLNDPVEAGKVVDEISRSSSGVVNQVATKKNLTMAGLATAILVVVLVVLNQLGVISIF
jgi:CBS domain-containing protein